MTNKTYEELAYADMRRWQKEMQRRPSLMGKLTQGIQRRINRVIPEKVHQVITTAFKTVVQGVLTGARFVAGKPLQEPDLETVEKAAKEKIAFYKTAAATEGALTGAGGILLSLADFPLWLTLKMKMLYDVAAIYGYDASRYEERVYMLYIFQLAFSGRRHRRDIYEYMATWNSHSEHISERKSEFDWRKFQQEYRDYIDIAKLLQLIPGIGAAVGAYVNHRLTDRLAATAVNAYRMRRFAAHQ